jgi:hypothetical protein
MKWLWRSVLAILFVVIAVPCVALTELWLSADAAVRRAHLPSASIDTPLTTLERTIAISHFANTWNVRRAPCGPVADVWTSVIESEARHSRGVSQALTNDIQSARPREGALRHHVKRLFMACQFEQRFSDTTILRAWLSRVYFGSEHTGVENAAQILFDKSANALNAQESAQVAALLRAPRLLTDSARLEERARLIELRVEAYEGAL